MEGWGWPKVPGKANSPVPPPPPRQPWPVHPMVAQQVLTGPEGHGQREEARQRETALYLFPYL